MSSFYLSGVEGRLPQGGYTPKYEAPAAEGEAAQTCQQPAAPSFGQAKEMPSIFEAMQEAREKAEAQRKKFQIPKNPAQYASASIEAYLRLARARNRSEVSAAAGYARRRIVQLKAAKCQDSDNARQIQAVINQLQKAVSRAGKKKSELERERLTEIRRDKLELEKQRRKAQRLHQQLQRQKALRIIRESGYLREAEIDNRLQAQLSETQMELRAQAQALSESAAASLDASIQQYASQVPVETAAPAGEICTQA